MSAALWQMQATHQAQKRCHERKVGLPVDDFERSTVADAGNAPGAEALP